MSMNKFALAALMTAIAKSSSESVVRCLEDDFSASDSKWKQAKDKKVMQKSQKLIRIDYPQHSIRESIRGFYADKANSSYAASRTLTQVMD